VAALVALGANVDAVDMKGLTPLDRAAGKGEVAAIRELVRRPTAYCTLTL
jgi:ankyrin repeat protein